MNTLIIIGRIFLGDGETTIPQVATSITSGLAPQLWAVAGIAVAIVAIVWGVPLGVRFLKKLAK